MPEPDFSPGGGSNTHATILLEWTAGDPAAATYDGGPPRELLRLEQPFRNHNAGHMSFNPLAEPGAADFGLLYVGVADGGSGGDPLGVGQNLGVPYAKILRLDPIGSNSANGQYGIPASNPFVSDGDAGTLGEIYAYGARNPQRFGWDRGTGTCSWPTSDRTSSKNSAWLPQARISGGTRGKAASSSSVGKPWV